MSYMGEMQEKLRRLHAALESHPLLSGMMTDEHQRYLRDLAECEDEIPWPQNLTPDWSKEMDLEEFDEETSRG